MQTAESAEAIRREIIAKAYECGEASHIGGSLSMVDILAVLFGQVLNYNLNDPLDPKRDIFILSKGHCVLGYFAAMTHFDLMSREVFDTFQRNGSDLIAHPVKKLSIRIESSNGSLGQGLSFGLGHALGDRLRNNPRRTFVLMGDGECNEGAVWESVASAAEFGADNLIAIVDINGLRNDGSNLTYGSVDKFAGIWRAYGWNTIEVDGHDHSELAKAFADADEENSRPTVLLCDTIKGRGISFMEANNEWHHNRITEKVYNSIIGEWGLDDRD